MQLNNHVVDCVETKEPKAYIGAIPVAEIKRRRVPAKYS
jgi:hypothetical protein